VTTVAAMFGNRHWLFAVTVRGGTSDISKQEMNERSQTSVTVAQIKKVRNTQYLRQRRALQSGFPQNDRTNRTFRLMWF
jgi:hypothetical protein